MKFTILEKVFDVSKDGDIYYIYLNPTSQELHSKEDSKDNRGIVDKNGDLYMEARWSDDEEYYPLYSNWVHDRLLSHLHKKKKCLKLIVNEWWRDEDSLNYGVCVQRDEDTLNFYVAESYEEGIRDFHQGQIEEIFKLAKKKNPSLTFYQKNIFDVKQGVVL